MTVPAHDGGLVNIHVTTPAGTSASNADAQFRYVPPPRVDAVGPAEGSPAGGATVTVTGVNFRKVRAVTFGTTPATFAVDSTQALRVTVPAHEAGRAHVVVTTSFGTAPRTDDSYYRYVAPPVVHALSPDHGPAGTTVTVTGANFRGGAAVSFGQYPASAVSVVSPTELRVTAPEHPDGLAGLTVTTPYGASSTLTYTYP